MDKPGDENIEDGTLRVEHTPDGIIISGDTYFRPYILADPNPEGGGHHHVQKIHSPPPKPENGILIQGIKWYNGYRRITKIDMDSSGENLNLEYERWWFKRDKTWQKLQPFTVAMRRVPAPSGYPSQSNYFEGDVINPSLGLAIGRMAMGWVAESYRKVTVEIDTVSGPERPLSDGGNHDWSTVFFDIGFDLDLVRSDTAVPPPGDDSWSAAELHAAMLIWRDKVDLDKEWRYYILAVKRLDAPALGLMFDYSYNNQSTDTNKVPREGAAVGADWVLPATGDIDWGQVKGLPLGKALPVYFRTVIHETGHAMGLLHPKIPPDNGFMTESLVIAKAATNDVPFPKNIKWAYSDEDLRRLRHWPDIQIRPGGTPFTEAIDFPLEDRKVEIQGLNLSVVAFMTEVPIGAPVRIELKLENKACTPIQVPSSISLNSPFVTGFATEIGSGKSKTFSPFSLCSESTSPFQSLNPGSSIFSSLTLFGGHEGPLFPLSSLYSVAFNISWPLWTPRSEAPSIASVSGTNTVFVTPPRSASHSKAAHRLFATTDTHLVLVLGGDSPHLEEGRKAIDIALQDNALRPHWAVIKAKRLGRRFMERKPDLRTARQLVAGGNVVATRRERQKLESLGILLDEVQIGVNESA
ncbi:hypothetical protein N7471_010607 [Penicillium samsonianum]|uniref:uncharacterized protein n=1 Tax=Penicillium samsonianum TaxID=1882272 RepID=UPI00254975FD|nr:uncharacterized protein N7471_010607 [Penicillium samsonianum]KAJ6126114.1 hypothetical protein N7471_010607 [Penicillium samsonianum]